MLSAEAFIRIPEPYIPHGRVLEDMPSVITTASGRHVNPLDVNPDDIIVEDVAHHLGNQCRWAGAIREFLSVSQHTVLVSHIVPKEDAYDGLWHDSPEYILQDMVKPLKNDRRFGQAYRGAEARLERIIAEKFGVNFGLTTVKRADLVALTTEARDLHHGTSHWGHYQDVPKLDKKITPWSPRRSRREWMIRYKQLTA